jgi:hypothetical protein
MKHTSSISTLKVACERSCSMSAFPWLTPEGSDNNKFQVNQSVDTLLFVHEFNCTLLSIKGGPLRQNISIYYYCLFILFQKDIIKSFYDRYPSSTKFLLNQKLLAAAHRGLQTSEANTADKGVRSGERGGHFQYISYKRCVELGMEMRIETWR